MYIKVTKLKKIIQKKRFTAASCLFFASERKTVFVLPDFLVNF